MRFTVPETDAPGAQVFWSRADGRGWDAVGGMRLNGEPGLRVAVDHFSAAFVGQCSACPAPCELTSEKRGGSRKAGGPAADTAECKECSSLPQGCRVDEGHDHARWLQCFRDNAAPYTVALEPFFNVFFVPFNCPLPLLDEQRIREFCGQQPDDIARIRCTAWELADRIGEESVCRHYSSCMTQLLGAIGIESTEQISFDPAGHAWNEAEIDTDGDGSQDTRVISDAYAKVRIVCPIDAEPGEGLCDGTGCCNGKGCQSGDSDTACGTGGDTCARCHPPEFCLGGSCQECNATTCPDGCCTEEGCQRGTSDQACGSGGGACASCGNTICGPDQRCVKCGPETCPDGCCGREIDDSSVCYPGTENADCGDEGRRCDNCSSIGRVCRDRACAQSPCKGCPDTVDIVFGQAEFDPCYLSGAKFTVATDGTPSAPRMMMCGKKEISVTAWVAVNGCDWQVHVNSGGVIDQWGDSVDCSSGIDWSDGGFIDACDRVCGNISLRLDPH